jgi:glycosyltransferase involved in cell wall biosynthesis
VAERATHWLAIAEEDFLPADSGGRFESLNLVRAASTAGVRLHVVVPGLRRSAARAHADAVPGSRCEGIPRRTGWRSHLSLSPYLFVSRPLDPEFVTRVRAAHARDPYDAVLSVSFRAAHIGELLAAALGIPLVVRPHNIESEYFRELARGTGFPRNLPYLAEAWKLKRSEAAVHASRIVTMFADIAKNDAAIRSTMTSIPVIHIPPFVPPVRPSARVRPVVGDTAGVATVLFLGALDGRNNRAGIRWFVENCWPHVRVAMPGTQLHVVGRRAPAGFAEELRAAGVRVTVDAPDVVPHLAEADVFVNPVGQGAGINIKMVEAMAAGLPVVTTPTGARGLHWRHGEHLIVCDGPTEFATGVVALLDDAERREHLGRAARRFVADELDGVRQITKLRDGLSRPQARH